jgi:hypothetical protein
MQSATGTPESEPAFPALVLHPADQPGGTFFDVTLDPGQQKSFRVIIGNSGKVSADARTYVADAYTLINGGFGLKTPDAPHTGVTTWLDYPTRRLALAPGEGISQEFTIKVPADAQPGQYKTGLSLETAEPLKTGTDTGQLQLKQILRKVIAVMITVPGPVTPSFTITDPDIQQGAAGAVVSATIANTGNIKVKPAGDVQVTDADGNTDETVPVQMGSVYPGDTTQLRLGLGGSLPYGDFHINIDFLDEATKATASIKDAAVEVSAPATPGVVVAITFVNAEATPKPSADKLQFLDISATINNTGDATTNARVVLHAMRDGKVVEDFPLASSLALPNGNTTVQGRYIPADGWTKGEWTFTLTVESVDPGTGAARVIDTIELGKPITIS